MKILFISSGNSKSGISPIILNQGNSLVDAGNSISYFAIKGNGIIGYLKNIKLLKKHLKDNNYDVIHAHYIWCGIIATLAGAKPLVVSLMGSDVKGSKVNHFLSFLFSKFFWKKIIVKSEDMLMSLKVKKAVIIPNGVNFEIFKPVNKNEALAFTKWDITKKHVLFAGDPKRKVKNFELAKSAIEKISDNHIELHVLTNIDNKLLPFYYCAADVILLTSLWEGSPNVIKEAMACNRPIVSTNTGDVQKVIGNTKGCFITDYSAEECKQKIMLALSYDFTDGRENIKHLNSKHIANLLVNLYQSAINEISK